MASSAKNRPTADNYIKNYRFTTEFLAKPGSGATSERMAQFLRDFAEEYPGEFVSRAWLVKIGHNLPALPRDSKHEKMRSCSNHAGAAGRILLKRYQQHVVPDRVLGYRATTDANDIHDNKYKPSLHRQVRATQTAKAVAETINPQQLSSGKKEEFLKTRGLLKNIETQLTNLLPAKTKG